MKINKKRILYTATLVTSLVYIIWRAFFTLPFRYGALPLFFGVLLLVAEAVGFLEAANIYSGISNIFIPQKPDLPPEDYPPVDVFIATYNEPARLLEKTIFGCLNMDYPDRAMVHIYVCDDGGRGEIRDLCRRMGVGYLDREDHRDAKAGNYNHALSCTSSPLVATFDADMIPRHDFLMELVPYFFTEDYKAGFIQSPQSFYNSDLFQYNLYSESRVPNEQDFFFREVQLARNNSNSAIYGGSNTILLRKALEEAGGFYTGSITEDLATGLLIQSLGYKGYAVPTVHASGLSPTELSSLFKQRERWARGCIQTARKLRLLTRKGLSPSQRISYLFSLVYWYTPFRRCIFILAPILYSVFGIPVLDCTLKGILLFWLPQVLLYNITLSQLTGNIRTSRLSNIYDTILFPSLLLPVFLETIGISKLQFAVTNKDKSCSREKEDRKAALKCGIPHAILLTLSVAGILRCLNLTLTDQTPAYGVILLWLFVNGYHIVMALFFILGRKVFRSFDRFDIHVDMELRFDDQVLTVRSLNMSEGGAAFLLDFPAYIPDSRDIHVSVTDEDGRYHSELEARVVFTGKAGSQWRYGLKFHEPTEHDRLQLVGILHDRIPPMPEKVSEASGFYEDFAVNLHQRRKRPDPQNRKLPRIDLEKKLPASTGGEVLLRNFNYEYALLETLAPSPELEVTADDTGDLKLSLKLAPGRKTGSDHLYLYHVENYPSLIYNEAFYQLLEDWAAQFEAGRKEREYRAAMAKIVYEEEFSDIAYISDHPCKTI